MMLGRRAHRRKLAGDHGRGDGHGHFEPEHAGTTGAGAGAGATTGAGAGDAATTGAGVGGAAETALAREYVGDGGCPELVAPPEELVTTGGSVTTIVRCTTRHTIVVGVGRVGTRSGAGVRLASRCAVGWSALRAPRSHRRRRRARPRRSRSPTRDHRSLCVGSDARSGYRRHPRFVGSSFVLRPPGLDQHPDAAKSSSCRRSSVTPGTVHRRRSGAAGAG